jgi:hypothetical protein
VIHADDLRRRASWNSTVASRTISSRRASRWRRHGGGRRRSRLVGRRNQRPEDNDSITNYGLGRHAVVAGFEVSIDGRF